MVELKTPMFPESVADGTLAQWTKNEGEFVNEGDIVAEIEIDKVVLEVPATASGVLTGVKKKEGDIVLSQEALASIDTNATAGGSNADTPKVEAKQEAVAPAQSAGKDVAVKAPVFPESVADGTISEWHKQADDVVAEGDILAEIETDKVVLEVPATVGGTLAKIVKQAGDTVLSGEEIAVISEGGSAVAVSATPAKEEKSTSGGTTDPHLVPSARKAFNASGLDSASNISGTGKKGRITSDDVKKASSSSTTPAPVAQGKRYEKRVKMTRLRQTIANRLVDVQQTNAILTTFNEVDMTAVMEIRKKYKDMFAKEHDTKLGFMSFFLKASTEALKKFPDVNASIDGDDIVYHNYFDISIAVGTDRGLVVPVLKDVDDMSLADLENAVVEKAIKARGGKLTLEDMQGGTFTITNGGTYGSMLSTPIINSPQSAILGMHNIVERPMVVDDEIKIRPIMYLALSYDHRIIDGGTSVRFLKMIKELLEDPTRILLQV